jgi:proteasome accessory factor B
MSSAKTERLINLTMALLASRRFMPKSEIFRRVAGYEGAPEAMERMFERDKDELRSMGIEIEVASHDPLFEDEVGYRILAERYRMKPNFNARELGLLSVALAVVGGDLDGPSTNMAQRLNSLNVTPISPEEIYLFSPRTIENNLVEITRAIASRSEIRFEYQKDGDRQPESRALNPFGLGGWQGNWYLVGEDLSRNDIRVFRISRITSTITADKKRNTFEIPEDFRVRDYLIMIKKPNYQVEIKLRHGFGDALLAKYATEITKLTSDDDWQSITINFEDIGEAYEELSAYSSNIVVEKPRELRIMMARNFETIMRSHV